MVKQPAYPEADAPAASKRHSDARIDRTEVIQNPSKKSHASWRTGRDDCPGADSRSQYVSPFGRREDESRSGQIRIGFHLLEPHDRTLPEAVENLQRRELVAGEADPHAAQLAVVLQGRGKHPLQAVA